MTAAHSDWSSISITAHYTAQCWVRQALPWAWRFDTWQGRVFWGLVNPMFVVASRIGLTSPPDFLIQRQRMLDALVERLGPRQLINLGAGLCPRAVAHAQRTGHRCVEGDLPRMVQLKAERIGPRRPPSFHQASIDLMAEPDYAASLGHVLGRERPVVVITEGLLPYFSLEQRALLFRRVAALLRQLGGGTYLTDVHHQLDAERLGWLSRAFRAGQHLVARTPVYPLVRDGDEGRRMLLEAGFSRVAIHDPEDFAHLGLPQRPHSAGLKMYESTV